MFPQTGSSTKMGGDHAMQNQARPAGWKTELRIGRHGVGAACPTCFIADIGSNHEGDLQRARDLIHLGKEAGADVAKFQHFRAESIASDYGFRRLPPVRLLAGLTRPVSELYQQASMPRDWTPVLAETCRQAGITFLTRPTSPDLVAEVDPYVPSFKVASGDLTWTGLLEQMANEQEWVILQRRAVRAKRDLPRGTILRKDMFDVLRPCPRDAIPPSDLPKLDGRTLQRDLRAGDHITRADLGGPGA